MAPRDGGAGLELARRRIAHRLRSHRAALRLAAAIVKHDQDDRLPRLIAQTKVRQDECRACLDIVEEALRTGGTDG